jgi:hypothetical protein
MTTAVASCGTYTILLSSCRLIGTIFWRHMALLSNRVSMLQSFVQEIRVASPKTKIIVPKYFEAIPLETVAK